MASSPDVVVIGISGVTCGGKSTLAYKLKNVLEQNFPCKLVGIDDYYKDEKDIPFDSAINLQEWDTLKAFQLDKLHDQVKACIEDLKSVKFAGNEDAAVLIIEGILIFEDKILNNLMDKRYFMTLPYDETERRRRKRVYEPPEEPELFDAHVWPKYVEYRDSLRRNSVLMTELDASRSFDDVFSLMMVDLNETFWPNNPVLISTALV